MAGLEQNIPKEQTAHPVEHLMETPEIFRNFEQLTQSGAERPRANMEQAFRNLEKLEGEKGPHSKMEQVFRNLEAMEAKEGGRCIREDLTPDGILRETITRQGGDETHLESLDSLEQLRDLEAAGDVWHRQEHNNTCVLVCSEFIINEFKETHVTEGELLEFAESQNWMREGGTSLYRAEKLLEAYGVESRLTNGASYLELKSALSGRDRVIVGVNNVSICTEWCDQYPAFSANHAIEVLDIDESDPKDVKVIINDPGVHDGRMKAVGLANFLDAWGTSGNQMLTAFRS